MIVDSSLLIAHWRNNRAASALLAEHESRIVVPHVVIAELLAGAKRAANSALETARVNALWELFPICWPDRATVEVFASIRAELSRIGAPIGTHDVWIAAMALQHQMPVATTDADFDRVPGLTVVRW